MKTILPNKITSIEEAKNFLKSLSENGEMFHPEDDANDINFEDDSPTKEECDKLNTLMDEVYSFDGFDPCEYILDELNEYN